MSAKRFAERTQCRKSFRYRSASSPLSGDSLRSQYVGSKTQRGRENPLVASADNRDGHQDRRQCQGNRSARLGGLDRSAHHRAYSRRRFGGAGINGNSGRVAGGDQGPRRGEEVGRIEGSALAGHGSERSQTSAAPHCQA